MPVFFGIDVGTSSVKAAVLDLDALQLRHIHRVPMPEFVGGLPASHREVDPAAVVEAVENILARLARLVPRCGGLMLCGQMQGFVLVNARGEAVSNYISWLDQRVSPAEFDEMAAQLTPAERDDLGNDLKPGIALPVLYWLARRNALPSGDVTPVSLADFVAGRLCGAMPAMEPTQAAAFGALSLTTLRWRQDAIGKLGLQSLRWPEVRPSGSIAGMWQGAPCVAAVGDQQCALFGASLGDRELSVNIGTGSQVSMIADSARPGGQQVRPYFDGRFLRTITHIPGGRALRPLIRLLTEIGGASEEGAWQYIEQAVAAVGSTDLRASVAFFPGPCGYGGFLENLHDANLAIGHVFRAAFESMARNYETCARRIDPDGRAEAVVFSGGVARRIPLLRDLTAAALGLPQRLSPHAEDTLFGLMMLGRVWLTAES
ncbi:putative Xylulose kinase [Candidatus Sulfopaludibacter sp. SbA4]|nr:putative Xylulose kinase [Candidatus Sulfopaludibacter sp. SbA4]